MFSDIHINFDMRALILQVSHKSSLPDHVHRDLKYAQFSDLVYVRLDDIQGMSGLKEKFSAK